MAKILFTHGPIENGTLATRELFKNLESFGHLLFLFRLKRNPKGLKPWLIKYNYISKEIIQKIICTMN